jgi:taurine dioxygenase
MSILQIEKTDACLGAVVQGLDLRGPLTADVVEALRGALYDYQVLFFRDQDLSDDQHLDFARCFGQPNLYPIVEMLGIERPLEMVEDNEKSPPKADRWHTDVTWLADPPKLGVLSAQVIPPQGGDTLWCNTYEIYDALPKRLRERVESLEIQHVAGEHFLERVVAALGEEFIERFRARYGDGARHPLVRKHPVTGRTLIWLSGSFMDHVVGMERREGRALLDELMNFADDPRFTLRWKWRENDVALWDERSTMHRVDADHWPMHRLMRRCTVETAP